MDFVLTGMLRIGLSLVASAGVLFILGTRLRARLSLAQYAVIGLTVVTAAIHLLSGGQDYLLYLNGMGFMILLTVLYFVPLGPLEIYRDWLYMAGIIYIFVTIFGYFVVHPRPWSDPADTLGLFTKVIEVLLLGALVVDYLQGGQPVAPLPVTPDPAAIKSDRIGRNGQISLPGPALEVRGLKYSYPAKPNVLQDINLTLQPKERVGLIGPNGAGKTTLFMTLVGIQRPEAGDINLFGQPMKHRDFRSEIGMVFQNSDDQLFSPSVRDDVAFGPHNLGLSAEEIEQRVEEALITTGMAQLADRPPHHLSGGEKRMVSIAGVMAMRPQLVIYDEPSANLDIRARRRLIEFLQQTDHAFIISSNDLEFLLEVCERIILLDEGRIIADGSPQTVMSNEALMLVHGLERPPSLSSTEPA